MNFMRPHCITRRATQKHSGFRDVVVLPKGTNYPLRARHDVTGEDKLLAATNKWLIGHAEGGLPEGSFLGLKGKNISVK